VIVLDIYKISFEKFDVNKFDLKEVRLQILYMFNINKYFKIMHVVLLKK